MTKSNVIFIDKGIVGSKACRDISSSKTFHILLIFFRKRIMVQRKITGKKKGWIIENNGRIEFTYDEAQKKYGTARSTFSRAIKELVSLGFIDVAEYGTGLEKSKNLYGFYDRWGKYGTDEYIPPNPRPPIRKGFQKGNKLGVNSKLKASVTNEH
jgi:hypothetical protein